MDGQHLGERSYINSSAMNDLTKMRRVKAGRILLSTYGSRDKVKRLIRYPEIVRAKFNLSGVNATPKIKVSGASQKSDITELIGTEVMPSNLKIDASKKDVTVEISAEQNGASWSLTGAEYQIDYDDGSTAKRSLFPAKSGDGTDPAIVVAISDEIPAPAGWPKL